MEYAIGSLQWIPIYRKDETGLPIERKSATIAITPGYVWLLGGDSSKSNPDNILWRFNLGIIPTK